MRIFEKVPEGSGASDPEDTTDLATACKIIGSILILPLLVAGYFYFKTGFKSWRWALICLVLTTLVILDIWTGVKDYSVEATIAVNIVAVCLGGMGWLTDYCIRSCHE